MAQIIFSKPKKKYKDYAKHKIWLEQNSFPMFCGYSWLIDQKSLSIDHYKPKEHYPELKGHPGNFILCTQSCNSSKGDYHPEIKERSRYKQDNHKIFNLRQEDVGKYVSVKSDGSLCHRSAVFKDRFYFNSKIFRLNDPRTKEIRKEYVNILKELKDLRLMYKKLQTKKGADKIFFKRIEKLLKNREKACSRRLIFYKLLNIKIPKSVEKLLTNQTTAKFYVGTKET